MAVTIHQQPQRFQPAVNPYIWTFSSDQTAQPNFSFIVELYVDGSLVSTHQVFNEVSNYAKFDASGDLRCLLTSEMVTTGALLTYYDPAFAFVNIRVYERYGTPPTLSGVFATGTASVGWNASLRHPEFINYDYLDWMVSRANPNSGNIKFLTDFPRANKYFVGLYESAFLTFLTNSNPGITFYLDLYTIGGTLITSYSTTLSFNRVVVIDASPQNLIANTTVTALDFQNCGYYKILVQGLDPGTNSGFSEAFIFWMDTECHRYETRRLHWLNKLGGWDSFTFTLVSIDSSNIQMNDYQRERGRWDGTNWNYSLYSGEQMVYNKYTTDTLVLNSDWISPEVQNWLVRDLYESPKVYLEVTPGAFEPVKVTNNSSIQKQRRVDGLIRETVNIERTYSYNSQLT